MKQNAVPICRDAKHIRVGFFKPGHSVRSFAKWPFPGLLEPELTEEEFIEWSAHETTERIIFGRYKPILPDCDTAVTLGIDMAFSHARNSTTNLKNLGFTMRKAMGQLYPDCEFGDRSSWRRHNILLKYKIAALDTDFLAILRRAQLWLVKGDGSLGPLQR